MICHLGRYVTARVRGDMNVNQENDILFWDAGVSSFTPPITLMKNVQNQILKFL